MPIVVSVAVVCVGINICGVVSLSMFFWKHFGLYVCDCCSDLFGLPHCICMCGFTLMGDVCVAILLGCCVLLSLMAALPLLCQFLFVWIV